MIPCSLYRGGTSKGLFFLASSLPSRGDDLIARRTAIIQRALGSPDATGMQLNGMGGGISSTSKVAIITSPSLMAGFDLDYEFAQVDMVSGDVDWSGTCGNLAAAVLLFARDEKLGTAPTQTPLRVRGVLQGKDDYPYLLRDAGVERQIPGVPGVAPGVDVAFPGPRLLGPLQHQVPLQTATVRATAIQGANTTIFVNGDQMSNNTPPDRNAVVAALGFDANDVSVRVSAVHAPRDYVSSSGDKISKKAMDVFATISTPGRTWHHAFTGSGLANLVAACVMSGTIPNELCRATRDFVRIGHPGGVTTMMLMRNDADVSIVMERSARLLMRGMVNGA
jgi:2-methylaconitate cis-trans-isomerase PrpF